MISGYEGGSLYTAQAQLDLGISPTVSVGGRGSFAAVVFRDDLMGSWTTNWPVESSHTRLPWEYTSCTGRWATCSYWACEWELPRTTETPNRHTKRRQVALRGGNSLNFDRVVPIEIDGDMAIKDAVQMRKSYAPIVDVLLLALTAGEVHRSAPRTSKRCATTRSESARAREAWRWRGGWQS